MNKTLSFVKLDFVTVKPYFAIKNIIMFAGMIFIMGITDITINWMIGFYTFIFAVLFVSYPFAVGEQNGIDMLYSTLSIRRETVVLGRYVFGLCINAMSGIIVYALALISAIISKKTFNYTEGLIVVAAIFMVCGIMQALQLPIYFKLGYAKAKFLAYVPLLIPTFGISAFSLFFKDSATPEWLANLLEKAAANPFIIVIIGVGMWLVAFGVSYKISLAFYKKRDF